MFSVYNSLSKKKEPFDHNKDVPIKWYTCGPTVYDSAHVGHARTFLTFDIIRRIFEHYGYQVYYVMNITDVDDKIIERTTKDNLLPFVRTMEQDFWEDMDDLNVIRPHMVTRVTEYSEKMIEYVEHLINLGFAYESNGSVYFDHQAYIDAGLNPFPLQKIPESDFTTEPNTYKKSPKDFALWKKSKEDEFSFSSSWSDGRPGWHLECSVMSRDILGQDIDIHSGGIDLLFPHHQNEILQTNAHVNDTNFEWIKTFLHAGHLNIDGQKMSKSLKNFVTIRNFLKKIGTKKDMRMLFLLHKWNKPMDYNEDTVAHAVQTNNRIRETFNHLEHLMKQKKETIGLEEFTEISMQIKEWEKEIDAYLKDNFNTPAVLETIMESIHYFYVEFSETNSQIVDEYHHFLNTTLRIFGLNYQTDIDIDTEKFVSLGIDLREDIRDIVLENKTEIGKDVFREIFQVLDQFRDQKLLEAGVVLQDLGNGSKFSFI